jgi:NADH-quinone oxidoreductase subunit K
MSGASGLTINHYLVLSTMLFAIGVLAVTLRRNAIGLLIGIELMLNAANINLVAFSRYLGNHVDGAVYAIFVVMLAAAEAAVAIAIVLNVFAHAASINVDDYTEMKG